MVGLCGSKRFNKYKTVDEHMFTNRFILSNINNTQTRFSIIKRNVQKAQLYWGGHFEKTTTLSPLPPNKYHHKRGLKKSGLNKQVEYDPKRYKKPALRHSCGTMK